MKDFIKNHILFLMSLAFLALSIAVFAFLPGTQQKRIDGYAVNMAQMRSEIDEINIACEQHHTQYVEKATDFDSTRKKRDDANFDVWISPAFSFQGSAEYMDHRQMYVDRLGIRDPFVTEVMVPYTVQSVTMSSTSDLAYDPNDALNMTMDIPVTYLMSIDKADPDAEGSSDEDVYHYVAFIKTHSVDLRGIESDLGEANSSAIVTYSVKYDTSAEENQNFERENGYDNRFIISDFNCWISSGEYLK